jgi:hypothetical protein
MKGCHKHFMFAAAFIKRFSDQIPDLPESSIRQAEIHLSPGKGGQD